MLRRRTRRRRATALERSRASSPAPPRGGAFADHDPHPEPALLKRLLVARALVIAPDPGGEIGGERAAGEPRCVAVDAAVPGEPRGLDLRERLIRAAHDAREVHHL